MKPVHYVPAHLSTMCPVCTRSKKSDSPTGETGVARTDGVHSTLPLTQTLSREGRGDGTALRTDYALDSRCARMTADGRTADYTASYAICPAVTVTRTTPGNS